MYDIDFVTFYAYAPLLIFRVVVVKYNVYPYVMGIYGFIGLFVRIYLV